MRSTLCAEDSCLGAERQIACGSWRGIRDADAKSRLRRANTCSLVENVISLVMPGFRRPFRTKYQVIRQPGTLSPANFRHRSAVKTQRREAFNKADTCHIRLSQPNEKRPRQRSFTQKVEKTPETWLESSKITVL